VGNTAMEIMNYSAPQDKEPASCGRRKFEECGNDFIPTPNSKGRFCSHVCQGKHFHKERTLLINCKYCGNAFEINTYEKKRSPKFCSSQCHIANKSIRSLELRICKECGNAFLEHKKKVMANGKRKEFCSVGCGVRYSWSHGKIIGNINRTKLDPNIIRLRSNARKHKYISSGIAKGKYKEAGCLKTSYGTMRVLSFVKKARAIQRLTKRMLSGDINKNSAKKILHSISEGRTYEAYL
jgi:hypothetical protein